MKSDPSTCECCWRFKGKLVKRYPGSPHERLLVLCAACEFHCTEHDGCAFARSIADFRRVGEDLDWRTDV